MSEREDEAAPTVDWESMYTNAQREMLELKQQLRQSEKIVCELDTQVVNLESALKEKEAAIESWKKEEVLWKEFEADLLAKLKDKEAELEIYKEPYPYMSNKIAALEAKLKDIRVKAQAYVDEAVDVHDKTSSWHRMQNLVDAALSAQECDHEWCAEPIHPGTIASADRARCRKCQALPTQDEQQESK